MSGAIESTALPIDDWDHGRAWHAPGTYRVADGVFRIPLPLPDDGLRAVNVFVVEGSHGLLLVDPGQTLDVARAQLVAGLARIDRRLEDVRRIVVTHVHRDHYTQAVSIRRELGTHVSLGRGEEPSMAAVRDPTVHRLAAQLDLLLIAGAPGLAEDNRSFEDGLPGDLWESPDQWLSTGDAVTHGDRMLDVHETPGHTRGHVVFRDASASLLFAGDHILPTITPSIGFEPEAPARPLADYLESLRLVRSFDDTWLLPAHGRVTTSVHARIDELLDHHADRLSKSLAHALASDFTAYEVAHRLSWTRHERALKDLSPFDQMLAVLETKAHLDVLADRGHLSTEHDGEAVRYLAPAG